LLTGLSHIFETAESCCAISASSINFHFTAWSPANLEAHHHWTWVKLKWLRVESKDGRPFELGSHKCVLTSYPPGQRYFLETGLFDPWLYMTKDLMTPTSWKCAPIFTLCIVCLPHGSSVRDNVSQAPHSPCPSCSATGAPWPLS
jgi:hypothetical protein